MCDLKECLALAIIAETSILVATGNGFADGYSDNVTQTRIVILPSGCSEDLILCEFSSSSCLSVFTVMTIRRASAASFAFPDVPYLQVHAAIPTLH